MRYQDGQTRSKYRVNKWTFPFHGSLQRKTLDLRLASIYRTPRLFQYNHGTFYPIWKARLKDRIFISSCRDTKQFFWILIIHAFLLLLLMESLRNSHNLLLIYEANHSPLVQGKSSSKLHSLINCYKIALILRMGLSKRYQLSFSSLELLWLDRFWLLFILNNRLFIGVVARNRTVILCSKILNLRLFGSNCRRDHVARLLVNVRSLYWLRCRIRRSGSKDKLILTRVGSVRRPAIVLKHWVSSLKIIIN